MFWFLWIVLLVCVAWAALAAVPAGADAHMPLPYLIALVPLLWPVPLAIAVAAIVMHEWGLTCGAVAAGLVTQLYGAAYWTNYSPEDLSASIVAAFAKTASSRSDESSGAATSRDARRETLRETTDTSNETAEDVLAQQRTPSSNATLTVMTLNCRYGRANAKEIVGAVLARNVSVLALQELTPELVDDLNRNGLDALLPYRQLGDNKESDNGGFNGIWIRVEPQASQASAVAIPAADVPSITIPVDSLHDITFASAHPKSPMRGTHDWSAGIIGLGELADATKRHDHDFAVVLGDLNSSPYHPSFRKLLASGFTDANLAVAQGPRYTFPRWTRWPRLILDHVLATPGIRFTSVESFEIADTDHLALSATLSI